jgi:hypothetical protein
LKYRPLRPVRALPTASCITAFAPSSTEDRGWIPMPVTIGVFIIVAGCSALTVTFAGSSRCDSVTVNRICASFDWA